MSGHEQRPGDWRVICARSGFKCWASECAKDWEGFWVLKRFLGSEAQRHPQEAPFVPTPHEGRVPWTQPPGTDIFRSPTSVTKNDL